MSRGNSSSLVEEEGGVSGGGSSRLTQASIKVTIEAWPLGYRRLMSNVRSSPMLSW